MKIATNYIKLEDKQVHCLLCPHDCIINTDKVGYCEVRKNFDGTLMSLNYGRVSMLHFDPIEKKPFYHFYPGQTILSIGSIGCNLHCTYCQSHQIAQSDVSKAITESNTPFDVIGMAQSREDNLGIAFTYNEPTIWFEFVLDVAQISYERGLKNVMVTNGFINPGPINELAQVIHAFNVDLKAFTEEFYRKITSSRLSPVKDTLKNIRKTNRHLEINYLVIPGLNDNLDIFEDMLKWITDELGDETVLHLSKYFPRYRMTTVSPSIDQLIQLYHLAKKYLKHVYLENVVSEIGHDTYCPSCKLKVIVRNGFNVRIIALHKGKCTNCGYDILNYA